MALGSATQEAIWLQQLLLDLRAKPGAPINIFEGNQGAIAMVKNPVGHKRTKHIVIKHHFIRETMQAKAINLSYCPSKNMLADIFIKSLPRTQFEKLRMGLGLM